MLIPSYFFGTIYCSSILGLINLQPKVESCISVVPENGEVPFNENSEIF